MLIFLTEPKLQHKNHVRKFDPKIGSFNTSTDFYMSKLFGPDADRAAAAVGIRKSLKTKEGVWVVTSKTTHKKLLKLGATQFSDDELKSFQNTEAAPENNSQESN